MPDNAQSLPPNANDGTIEGAAAAIPDNLISFEEAVNREAGLGSPDEMAAIRERNARPRDPATQQFTKPQLVTDQQQIQQPVDQVQDQQQAPLANASSVDEEMFELPPDREGEEPRRIPAREVFEGYQRAEQLAQELEQVRRVAPPPAEWDRQMYETVQVRSKLVQQLEMLERTMLPPAPDSNLINPSSPNYDPGTYHQQQQVYAQAQQRMQLVQQARAQEAQLLSQEREALSRAARAREQGKLIELWPEIRQPAVQRQVMADAARYYGIMEQDFSTIIDSRMYALLKDALAYRQSQSQRQAAVKVVRSVPKLVKAPARSSQTRSQQTVASGMRRLVQSGSIDDAADVIGGLLG